MQGPGAKTFSTVPYRNTDETTGQKVIEKKKIFFEVQIPRIPVPCIGVTIYGQELCILYRYLSSNLCTKTQDF